MLYNYVVLPIEGTDLGVNALQEGNESYVASFNAIGTLKPTADFGQDWIYAYGTESRLNPMKK